ncbi:hypothetical protein BAE44_0019667, partial [Dichanthelium oligosanthes]
LKLVAECVRSPVILESDCASVITSLTAKQDDRSRDMHILKEIQACVHLLSEVSKRLEVQCVAHELAQLAKRMDYSAVWRHSAPPCVSELLASNCNLTII